MEPTSYAKASGRVCSRSQHGPLFTPHLARLVHELQLAWEHWLVILWSRNGDENGIHRGSMTNLSCGGHGSTF